MSSQTLQPVVVYPNTVTRQPSSHSNGSFGSVFIVLSVIVVVSAIACCLGRICNRRFHHQKPKQNHNIRPKERDIEFGFEKGIPTAKPASNGESRGYKPSENGDIKSHTKTADGGEPRAMMV